MAQTQPDNTIVGLLEVDGAGPRLSWVFPSLGEAVDAVDVIASRAQLLEPEPITSSFSFSRYKSLWFYSLARDRKGGGDATQHDVVHPAVSRFALFIGSGHFHPERYEAMLHVLMRGFEGSPLSLLQRVLSVSTKGSASAPGGADFVASHFSAGLTETALASQLAATVRRVGLGPCATLWAAMMLRGRVGVLGTDAASVLSVVRTLPLLCTTRRRWEVLIPLCGLRLPQEIDELRSAGTYAAGFTDASIVERPELFDVLLVLDDGGTGSAKDHADLRLSPSGAHLQPPPSVQAELDAALGGCAADGKGGLLGALEKATARLLERARGAAAATGGQDDEEVAFLRRLHEAEGIGGAGAGA